MNYLERDVERRLKDRVASIGGMIRKVSWQGINGAPDRVIFLPKGKIVWVELKAPGKRPGSRQEREHELMAEMGQRVVVLDTIEAVDGFQF
jgi:hypothetical protein